MSVKCRKHTSYSVTDSESGREFDVKFCPSDVYGFEPIIKVLPNGKAIVGYLVQDEDCGNPLEDCEGMGALHDRRRRESTHESRAAFNEAMGLDQYGERDEGMTPNPLAVLLDCYEHSLTSWSVYGGGMQCQWDTSKGAGVWIPDESCIEHIKSEALKFCLPEGVKVEYKSKSNPDGTTITRAPKEGETPYFDNGTCIDERYYNVITYTLPDGREKGGYKTFESAYRAAAKALGIKIDAEARIKGERRAAEECAKGCIEEYNKWLSGDCYGVCVEVFDADGDCIEDDACWGYIGSEYAIKEVTDDVERRFKGMKPRGTNVKIEEKE